MQSLLNNPWRKLTPLLLFGWLAACDSNGNGSAGGNGRLELRLVDAPADEVKEIVVTITRVEAHAAGGGGWMVLGEKTATVDLLKLQGGTFAQLGVVSMPPGKITQMRLYVAEGGPNYVTTPDGVQHPLNVPSGTQSGIKIKGQFDWPPCALGNVTIDFDGKKSIFVHPKGAGAGDEWQLRPVVRLKSVSVTGDACVDAGVDAAAVPEGMTTPDGGAMVSPPVVMTENTPPISMTPPSDPCATVTCGEGFFCSNGNCLSVVE